MNKLNEFLEKNYKIVTGLSIVFGLFFILKLFWFGVDFICGSSGWISLCIIPGFEYSWTNAGYISMLFLLISIIGLFFIKFTGNRSKKVYISLFILLLGIIGKPIFYMVSPDFKFYDFGVKTYTDKEGNLTNMDLYLESIGKYCDNNIDNFKFKRVHRSDMCGGQYLYDFKTAEEYGKVFDYANKKNMWYLYKLTYSGANDFGLEKIINVYHDDTFYGKIIIGNWNDTILKNIILSKTNNLKITDLIKYINNELSEYKKKTFLDNSESIKYWELLDDNIYKKLKQIPEINTKIF